MANTPDKKVTFTFKHGSYEELEELARKRGDTVEQAIQIGMSLYRTVATAEQEGEKIFVAAADDQSEREVIIPKRSTAA